MRQQAAAGERATAGESQPRPSGAAPQPQRAADGGDPPASSRVAAVVAGAVQLAQAGPAGGTSGGATGDEPSGGADSGASERSGGARAPDARTDDGPVTRTVREINEVVPDAVMAALAVLALLSLLLGAGYLLAAQRARRLARRRRELLAEVGLLQTALLPPVPERVGAVRASVAYRPSDGPGAGGDFYDALTLPGGRAAFILGDVSGHGREALAHTAFMRYTLRAYLGAGLEPRLALQVAEKAVGGQLEGDFATVVVAVHDPGDGTLTYASAGHPAPIVTGSRGARAGGGGVIASDRVGPAHRPAPDPGAAAGRRRGLSLHRRSVRGHHGRRHPGAPAAGGDRGRLRAQRHGRRRAGPSRGGVGGATRRHGGLRDRTGARPRRRSRLRRAARGRSRRGRRGPGGSLPRGVRGGRGRPGRVRGACDHRSEGRCARSPSSWAPAIRRCRSRRSAWTASRARRPAAPPPSSSSSGRDPRGRASCRCSRPRAGP